MEPTETENPSEFQTTRTQLLVICSDPIFETVYRNRPQTKDVCTEWCASDEEGMKALARFTYDIVVADLSLFPQPKIHALVQIIRAAPEAEIIVISDEGRRPRGDRGVSNGRDRLFFKTPGPSKFGLVHRPNRATPILTSGQQTLGG